MGLDPQTIGYIGLIFMVIMIFIRIPVAFAMILIGFIGFFLIRGLQPGLSIMGNSFYEALSDYNFSAIPMFIFMGYLAYYCGIVGQLFDAARNWFGRLPGGMAQVTIMGGAAFGAVSGAGPASTATLSKIAYPEMVKSGVDRKLAYGVIASVGPLAVMIPPSILMIVFGIITQQSIGKLLIGGLFPGILAAFIFMMVVYVLVKRNPDIAPKQPAVTFKEKVSSLKGIWSFLLLIISVIGGIYSGIFTPTEAGSIGAFLVFILLLIKKGLDFNIINESLKETVKTTCMIFLLVCGTFVFSSFLSVTRIPVNLSQFLVGLPVEPIVILLGIIVMYLIMGMFIEMISAMFLTLPFIFPAIIALGYDPIWFGVLLVFLCEVALVTPPFGLSLFIVKGSIPGSDLKEIYRGSIPFIVGNLIVIVLLVMFPQIITFLPSLMDK